MPVSLCSSNSRGSHPPPPALAVGASVAVAAALVGRRGGAIPTPVVIHGCVNNATGVLRAVDPPIRPLGNCITTPGAPRDRDHVEPVGPAGQSASRSRRSRGLGLTGPRGGTNPARGPADLLAKGDPVRPASSMTSTVCRAAAGFPGHVAISYDPAHTSGIGLACISTANAVLTVVPAGDGAGHVTSDPTGID
jgi:hypothetical protein